MSNTRRLIIISLFGLLSFGATLRVGFMWDDHEMIEKNPVIKNWTLTNIRHAFTSDVFDGKGDAYYRPLQTLANMADYSLWGLNPFGYHLSNLLMHLFNALLLFVFLRRLLNDERLAFVTSLLFAIHPIIVEQLLIIAGRAELLSLLFMLAALNLTLNKNKASDIGAVICFLLACFSKESGIVLPFFIFLCGFLNPDFRRSWKFYTPYIFTALLYFVLRKNAVAAAIPIPPATTLGGFLIQELPTILVHYAGTLLFPTDLHSHRRMVFQSYWMYLSPALIALTLALAWLRRNTLALFCIAWFLIGFLTKIPILATNSLMLDHWAYVSGIAVCLGLASLFLELKLQGRIILSGVCCFWMAMCWLNITRRNTDKKLLEWALRYPSSSIVRYNLGAVYYEEGNYIRAEELFAESFKMKPSAITANGLALSLWKLGHKQEALTLLQRAIQAEPGFQPSYVNRDLIAGG